MTFNKEDLTLLDLNQVGLYIDGKWINSVAGGAFETINPSTGEVITSIPKGGTAETRRAIEAADEAFTTWSTLTAEQRGQYLLKLRDLTIEHTDELARIMSIEMGKPFTEAKGEVVYAANFLTWYAEEGRRVYGEMIPASAPNKRLFVTKQPIGVVAAITPWNFPLAMITRKLAPALAAGCTIIIKPASQTPLTAFAFAKLAEKAEIPSGVINIVAGSTEQISDEIFDNFTVRKISFTGSTNVGKQLVQKSANNLQRLSLELGGHAPFIVFPDANLRHAAKGALISKFRNTGQTCVCANRLYVHQSVKDEFAQLFKEEVEKLNIGNSLDEDVQIGPLVNESGVNKVIDQVDDALKKGATVLSGGKQVGDIGYFYEPTILDDVTEDMKIMKEETFGPVAPIITFETDEEVIKAANDTQYGLAAYLYTNEMARAIKVSEALEFGIVGINDPIPSVAQAPFGGMKQSGYGREGGHQGIAEYLEEKYISLNI